MANELKRSDSSVVCWLEITDLRLKGSRFKPCHCGVRSSLWLGKMEPEAHPTEVS